MNLRTLIILTILVLVFGACQKERLLSSVDQNKIYTRLVLEYNPLSDKTDYIAIFRFENQNGDFIRFDDGNPILCNGLELAYDDSRHQYKYALDGLVDSAVFEWTNIYGELYSNTIKMPASIDYPVNIDSLPHIPSAYWLQWQGQAISQPNEKVYAYINGGENKERGNFTRRYGTGSTIIQDSLNATRIMLYFHDQADNRLELSREFRLPLQASTGAGGSLEAVYKLSPKVVIVD